MQSDESESSSSSDNNTDNTATTTTTATDTSDDNSNDTSTSSTSEGENREGQDIEETEEEQVEEKIIKVDHANKSSGALILEKSPNFEGTSNLLSNNRDIYAMVPCDVQGTKYIIVGLSEDILIKQIKLSSFERYSSTIKKFQVLGSQTYPISTEWEDLGTYDAKPWFKENKLQNFDLKEPSWARYLKFRLLTHYGDEHYCTMTQIQVHGSTTLQGYHEMQQKLAEESSINGQKEHQENEKIANVDAIKPDTNIEEEKQENNPNQEQVPKQDEKVSDKKSTSTKETEVHVTSDSNENERTNQAVQTASKSDVTNQVEESRENVAADVNSKGDNNKNEDHLINEDSHYQDSSTNISTNEADGEIMKLEDNESINASRDPTIPTTASVYSSEKEPGSTTQSKEMQNSVEKKISTTSKQDTQKVVDKRTSTTKEGGTDIVESKNVNDDSDMTNDADDNVSKKEGANKDTKTSAGKEESSVKINTSSEPKSKQETKKHEKEIKSNPIQSQQQQQHQPLHNNDNHHHESSHNDSGSATSSVMTKYDTKRFPNAACLESLNFNDFKANHIRADTLRTQTSTDGLPSMPKNQPIFKELTDGIKVLQTSHGIYEQYIKEVTTCYQRVISGMVSQIDSLEKDQSNRFIHIEEQIQFILNGKEENKQSTVSWWHPIVVARVTSFLLSNWDIMKGVIAFYQPIIINYVKEVVNDERVQELIVFVLGYERDLKAFLAGILFTFKLLLLYRLIYRFRRRGERNSDNTQTVKQEIKEIGQEFEFNSPSAMKQEDNHFESSEYTATLNDIDEMSFLSNTSSTMRQDHLHLNTQQQQRKRKKKTKRKMKSSPPTKPPVLMIQTDSS